ncbi:nucleotidyltransferase family protein [uncultured Kushneria sp.]|uniref:nucleotidyltransferase family protein n=1 Tax=uncultured Kushneria sp. TaxID=905033 RepID=UPI0026350075|nr:nucleotidyltransferase family protein [uncultured Kushneria sp.]
MLGLILAAGHSRRFGSDKRLAALGGQTLLAATTARLAPHVSSIVVMLRHGEHAKAFGLPEETHILQAPSSPIGMGTSLAAAVSALLASSDSRHQRCEALALMLGDMPAVRAETLQALAEQARHDMIVRPYHQGRAGHPVIFGRAYWPALTELEGDEGARELLRRYPSHVVMLDVNDPGILTDIDTPDDLPSLQ